LIELEKIKHMVVQ